MNRGRGPPAGAPASYPRSEPGGSGRRKRCIPTRWRPTRIHPVGSEHLGDDQGRRRGHQSAVSFQPGTRSAAIAVKGEPGTESGTFR